MATRDLTKLYLKSREDAKNRSIRRRNMSSPNEGNSLMRDVEVRDWEAARQALPPVWVDIVDQVNEYIEKIRDKVEQLSKFHTKRLMVTFDDTEGEIEQQIDFTTQEITALFRQAEKVLKRMANQSQRKDTAADAKTRQNVQRSLATQLQSLSVEFRKSQKDYLHRVQNQKKGPAAFDFLSQKESRRKPDVSMDSSMSQTQLMDIELAEDIINERDDEIQQIANSIEELATIFKELAVLVIDQGTILDRIDYNMEQVVERTQQGIMELEHAEKIQKSSRPMKCIGLLLTLISIMTVILILKSMHH